MARKKMSPWDNTLQLYVIYDLGDYFSRRMTFYFSTNPKAMIAKESALNTAVMYTAASDSR